MLKRDEEKIFCWYRHIQDQKNSGLLIREYCSKFKLSEANFINYKSDFYFNEGKHKEKFSVLMDLVEQYSESNLSITKFCEKNKVSTVIFSQAKRYKVYWEIVNNMENKKNNNELVFVKVPEHKAVHQELESTIQAEVIEPQNDIEIMITKGVKVSISPNIESMKIIKIIELLKDL